MKGKQRLLRLAMLTSLLLGLLVAPMVVGATETNIAVVPPGGGDPPTPANLSLTKTADATGKINRGDQIIYTVQVTNSGETDATFCDVRDELPLSNIAFVEWIEKPTGTTGPDSAGVIKPHGGPLDGLLPATGFFNIWQWTGTVPANTTLIWKYKLEHTGDYGDKLENTAQVRHESISQAGVVGLAGAVGTLEKSVTVTVKDAPDLGWTVTSDRTYIQRGGEVKFTIIVKNDGEHPVFGLDLGGLLPEENTAFEFVKWIEKPTGTVGPAWIDGSFFLRAETKGVAPQQIWGFGWANGTVPGNTTLTWSYILRHVGEYGDKLVNQYAYAWDQENVALDSAALTKRQEIQQDLAQIDIQVTERNQCVSLNPTDLTVLTGESFTLDVQYGDDNGGGDLDYVEVMIADEPHPEPQDAIVMRYHVRANRLYLQDRYTNYAYLPVGGLVAGVAGTINNGLAQVDAGASSKALKADWVWVTWSLQAFAPMVGPHTIYVRATDVTGESTGWMAKGTITVQDAPAPTWFKDDGATVRADAAHTYAMCFQDWNGRGNLADVYVLVATAVPTATNPAGLALAAQASAFEGEAMGAYANMALVRYDVQANLLYLRNTQDTTWRPGQGIVPRAKENEKWTHAILRGANSAAWNLSGTELGLTVNLQLLEAMAGTQQVFLRAIDLDGNDTGWVQMGTIVVTTP